MLHCALILLAGVYINPCQISSLEPMDFNTRCWITKSDGVGVEVNMPCDQVAAKIEP